MTITRQEHIRKLNQNRFKNLTGNIYGRWTVIKYSGKGKSNESLYDCACLCGVRRIVKGPALTSGVSQSCGCRIGEANKKRRGKLHPNYRELSDKYRIYRRLIEGYPAWIKSVFKKDNYTCTKCNKKGITFAAHHLDGYNWAEGSRLLISNGVTLCLKCHKKFHNLYGKGNNTKEQYLEFIKEY